MAGEGGGGEVGSDVYSNIVSVLGRRLMYILYSDGMTNKQNALLQHRLRYQCHFHPNL